MGLEHPLAPRAISTDKADMAQVTSREEYEEWLKNNPFDFAQVIATRNALRRLPYAFAKHVDDEWVADCSFALFRVAAIFWIEYNFPAYDMRKATYFALAANPTAVSDSLAAIWKNVGQDCDWLTSRNDPSSASRGLTRKPLWPASAPEGWAEAHAFAKARLAGLIQGYSVWIDWYDRRIEGHDAAFAIPGDSDRTEDKKILARLADATNEDFWEKGATHVNTTLQSWIDEAREQAAIDYVASGAPLKLGSEAELAARPELLARLASVEDALAALKDQLASLTQTGHGGIGHNQPENATSLRDDEIALLQQKVASLEPLVTAAHAALTKPEPDVSQLVQLVPKLNRWSRAMQAVEDATSAKVREGIETWAGPAVLGGVGYLMWTTIPNALAEFSQYFYTYWIPILIG
jgi:hypothetical protein